MTQQLLIDLAKVKAIFQKRAILAIMGIETSNNELQETVCFTCGDHDCIGGLPCETGDGV